MDRTIVSGLITVVTKNIYMMTVCLIIDTSYTMSEMYVMCDWLTVPWRSLDGHREMVVTDLPLQCVGCLTLDLLQRCMLPLAPLEVQLRRRGCEEAVFDVPLDIS